MEKLISALTLTSFSKTVFQKLGFSEKDAVTSANCLIKADIRGIDSHGIARLAGYVRLVKDGRLNPKPQMQYSSRFSCTGLLNADRAIGFVSATEAMEKCIQIAEEHGCGMVAVKNSNHFGIAGQYAMMAAEKGLAGFAFTNASPLVAPSNSKQRMLGTNPIAAAFPSLKSKPFVLDMATTTAANGKLELLKRNGKSAPEGWIQNRNGQSSINPDELKEGGALLPLGGWENTGGHKGYGLGSLVDILSGVCSGANFGPWVPPFVSFLPLAENPVGEGIGHFFMAFRTDSFLSKDEFESRMERWMEAMRSSQKLGMEEVQVAGDPEWKAEEFRLKNGIPLHSEIEMSIRNLAEEFSIPNPLIL